jgi:hypothetical protein
VATNEYVCVVFSATVIGPEIIGATGAVLGAI